MFKSPLQRVSRFTLFHHCIHSMKVNGISFQRCNSSLTCFQDPCGIKYSGYKMWLQTVEVLHWWCERDTSHLSKTITELLDTRAVHNPNPSWGEKPQRTYQLHTKRPCPNQESSPGPLCCVMTVPTAVPHCCPLTHIHYLWRLARGRGSRRSCLTLGDSWGTPPRSPIQHEADM